MRLFHTNIREFGPDKVEKIEILKKKVKELEIDRILFSIPDRRWTSIVIEQTKYQLNKIDRNVVINTLDSEESSHMRSI